MYMSAYMYMYTDSYMRVTVVVVLVLVVMKLSQAGGRACGCGDPFPRPSLPHGLELLHRLRRRHADQHSSVVATDLAVHVCIAICMHI